MGGMQNRVVAVGPAFPSPPEPVPLPWKLEPVQVLANQLTCESLSSVFLTHGRATHTILQYDLKIWIGNQTLPKTFQYRYNIYMLYFTIPQNSPPPKNVIPPRTPSPRYIFGTRIPRSSNFSRNGIHLGTWKGGQGPYWCQFSIGF